MGFQEVADLDCTKTTALGGVDKKSNKKNPTSCEGYYIGTKQVKSAKSKTGFAALHVLQTKAGNVGIWGKTNLDQKMSVVEPGQMIRVTFVGMVETKNNPMYKYKVEVDASNRIEVATGDDTAAEASTDEPQGSEGATDESTDDGAFGYGDEPEEEGIEEDETQPDEQPVQRAQRPSRPASTPAASKVQALLNNRKAAKSA